MKYFINFLTLSRLAIGPFIFILVTIYSSYGLAFILFLLASMTDFWDGFLARKYNLESELGEILDPIADKILLTFILIALALNLESLFIGLISCIILAREFWVAALRDLTARNGKAHATKVTFLAKSKTAMQFTTLSFYLFSLYAGNIFLLFLSDFFLAATMIITIQTGVTYTRNTFQE